MQYNRGEDEGCSFILTSFSIWAPALQPWGGLKLTGIHAIILLLETGCPAAHMPHAAREPFVVLFSLFALEVIRRILTAGTDGTASFHNSKPGEPGNMRV